MASRQYRWARKKIAEGKCRQCGALRSDESKQMCGLCNEKKNTYQRNRKKE